MATKEELKAVFITGAVPTEADFHNLIDVAGEKGDPGADGFGTEAQYNDIIARLEALEAAE